MKTTLIAIIAALLVAAVSPASSEEQVQFNIVNLGAVQSRQVGNDVMVVLLQAAAQKNSSAEAAADVNETMAWADGIIGAGEGVSHRTMNYQTRPVYQNRTLTGWSTSQQLELRSADIDRLTTMVGTLQQRLQVLAMNFEVSPERRAGEIDTLIVEALEAFTAKAELVTQTLKASNYALVSIAINENDGFVPYRGAMQAEAMMASAPAPSVEAGDSRIQVSVSGAIQLIY